MATPSPSAVLKAIADKVEGITPTNQRTKSDVFRYLPSLDEMSEHPDRAFTFSAVTVDEFREIGCTVWELTADLTVVYVDTHAGYAKAGGALARVLDDARDLAVTLRDLTSLSYVERYEAAGSDTEQSENAIIHTRSFRLRYTET